MTDLYHLVFETIRILGSDDKIERAPIAGIGWIARDKLSGGMCFVPDPRGSWRAAKVEETVNTSTPTGAVIRVMHPNT